MAPVKFLTLDQVWVGVGDRVWAADGQPRQGLVTGFTRSDSGEEVVQVQVTHLIGAGREARQDICEYPFERVWSIEKNAWMFYIALLTERRSSLVREVTRLDDEIRTLWFQWAKP